MPTKKLISKHITIGSRTYFFDVQESVDKDKYLTITESRKSKGLDSYKRTNIMVFEEGLEVFSVALESILTEIKKENSKGKSYMDVRREIHPQAYRPWTQELDDELELKFCQGTKVKELSTLFERNEGAIRSRIKKLELKEKYPPLD